MMQQSQIRLWALYFQISIWIFYTLSICLVFDGLSQSIYFRIFFSKLWITFENMYLLSCWFHCDDIFYIKLRFCETCTIANSVTRILLIETLFNFRTLSPDLPITFTCMSYVSASLSCVSHSIDICMVAIRYIRNMCVVSTNQIADIFLF